MGLANGQINPAHRRRTGQHALIIEVVDTQEKLEPLLPELKHVIGDDGLVTIQETYVI
jgi:PII-like signaling protein